MAKTRRGVDADESGTTDLEIFEDMGSSSDSTTDSKTKAKAKQRPKRTGRYNINKTSTTILKGIHDPENRESWQIFFDIYCPYILRIGMRCGLDEQRAEDLVIIVMREVGEKIGTFKYNPEVNAVFRKWLKTVARCRAIDILRGENRFNGPRKDETNKADITPPKPGADKLPAKKLRKKVPRKPGMTPSTFEPDKLQDFDNDLDAMWERDEAKAILKIACRITKEKVSKSQWQLFECRVLRDWTVDRIFSTLGVTPNMVSIAKCRVLPVYQEACVEAKERLDRGPLSPLDRKALDESLPLPSYYTKTKSK